MLSPIRVASHPVEITPASPRSEASTPPATPRAGQGDVFEFPLPASAYDSASEAEGSDVESVPATPTTPATTTGATVATRIKSLIEFGKQVWDVASTKAAGASYQFVQGLRLFANAVVSVSQSLIAYVFGGRNQGPKGDAAEDALLTYEDDRNAQAVQAFKAVRACGTAEEALDAYKQTRDAQPGEVLDVTHWR